MAGPKNDRPLSTTKTMTNCLLCGKELTNRESIERGIGPDCAGTMRRDVANRNLMEPIFTYHFIGDICVLEDRSDGEEAPSLTNAIERAVMSITDECGFVPRHIIYLDADKHWDAVRVRGGHASEFKTLGHKGKPCTDMTEAINRYVERYFEEHDKIEYPEEKDGEEDEKKVQDHLCRPTLDLQDV